MSFNSHIAVWVCRDGLHICLQPGWKEKIYCTPIEVLGLPVDYFLDENGELTGAIGVHFGTSKKWIYLASKGKFYQVFYRVVRDRYNPEEFYLEYDAPKPLFKDEARYEIYLIRDYDRTHTVTLPVGTPVKGKQLSENIDLAFDLMLYREGENGEKIIGLYNTASRRESFDYVTPELELEYQQMLGTTEPVVGVEVTDIGLFIATSTQIYFYRRTLDRKIMLNAYMTMSPLSLIQDGLRKSYFTQMFSIGYSAIDNRGYLTVATNVGIFFSNLISLEWFDVSIRTEDSDGLHPIVSYARVETKIGDNKPWIYFSPKYGSFHSPDFVEGIAGAIDMTHLKAIKNILWPPVSHGNWTLAGGVVPMSMGEESTDADVLVPIDQNQPPPVSISVLSQSTGTSAISLGAHTGPVSLEPRSERVLPVRYAPYAVDVVNSRPGSARSRTRGSTSSFSVETASPISFNIPVTDVETSYMNQEGVFSSSPHLNEFGEPARSLPMLGNHSSNEEILDMVVSGSKDSSCQFSLSISADCQHKEMLHLYPASPQAMKPANK